MDGVSVDTEKSTSPKALLEGVASLSDLLSSDRDLQVYRKFGSLASRNLLCMQSELFDLETRLKFLDEEDSQIIASETKGYGDVLQSAKSWQYCLERQSEDERTKERVRLMREVRGLLAEYRTSPEVVYNYGMKETFL